MSKPSVRGARPDDLPAVEALITSEHLPLFQTGDFIDTFWAAEVDGEVVGCCGLEIYDDAGLLRSAVVSPSFQGTGLGRRLTDVVIEGARAHGVRDLYLFTMDAVDFFAHMGFEKCTVADFSPAGQKSTQWRALKENPEVAKWLTAMRMRLDG